MAQFDGYPKSVDFGLLVALAEGGEPVPEVEYTFGGRREFFADPPPWYARPGAIPEEEGE